MEGVDLKKKYLVENQEKHKNNIKKILNSLDFSENNIIALMSFFRNLIEFDNSTLNYELLNFFCDWCLHPHLNRPGKSFLFRDIQLEIENLNQLSKNNGSNGLKENFSKAFFASEIAGKIISAPELLLQIENIINKKLNLKEWRLFRDGLIRCLVNVPYSPNFEKDIYYQHGDFWVFFDIDFIVLNQNIEKKEESSDYVADLIFYFKSGRSISISLSESF
ncbi:MAG TPA: hypothetical protein PLB38_00640 [bacterium]|nr:hypothetical protein [bacterium]